MQGIPTISCSRDISVLVFLCEEDADSVIRTVNRGMVVVVEWQGYIAPGPNRWCGPGTDVLRLGRGNASSFDGPVIADVGVRKL